MRLRVLGIAALCVAAIGLAANLRTIGQDKPAEDPIGIVARVKAIPGQSAKPFQIVVTAKIKEGKAKDFEAAMAKVIAPTRKEKGCKGYELHRDLEVTNRFVLFEHWQDLAAFEAHMKAPYLEELLNAVHDLLAEPPKFELLMKVGS